MKDLKNFLVFTMILAILLLTGCGAPPEETHATRPPLPVEESTETVPDPEKNPMEDDQESNIVGSFTGYLAMEGMRGSVTYEGGVLTVPFVYEGAGVGIGAPNGFGAFLILDGVPQPYYTDEEPEWAYFHRMPDEPDEQHTVQLHLIPVTGTAGDHLTLTLLKVNDPEYRMSEDGISPFKLVDMAYIVGRNINFTANPPECPKLEGTNQILDIQMTTRDTEYSEIAGWTEEELDLSTKHESHVNVGNRIPEPYSQVWGVSADETVTLHISAWGNPGAKQSLVLYVNNEPQMIDPSQAIRFSTEQGKTTEYDITIDNTNMEAETVIYGIRIVENYLDCDPNMIGEQYSLIEQKFLLKDEWSEERFPMKNPGA